MPIETDENKRLLNKAAAYAAKAERSPREVAEKVRQWAHEPIEEQELQKIIEDLRQDHFVDEERYARHYTADKVRFLKKGPLLIRRELAQKGIPSPIIDQALLAISDETWADALVQYLLPKADSYRQKSDSDYHYRARLMQAAYLRGYPMELAEVAMDSPELAIDNPHNDDKWY